MTAGQSSEVVGNYLGLDLSGQICRRRAARSCLLGPYRQSNLHSDGQAWRLTPTRVQLQEAVMSVRCIPQPCGRRCPFENPQGDCSVAPASRLKLPGLGVTGHQSTQRSPRVRQSLYCGNSSSGRSGRKNSDSGTGALMSCTNTELVATACGA